MPSVPSNRGLLSDSTKNSLIDAIAEDAKVRKDPRKERFDDVLVNKLIVAAVQVHRKEKKLPELSETDQPSAAESEEATCVVRRFLVLTRDMHVDKVSVLLASAKKSTSKVLELSK